MLLLLCNKLHSIHQAKVSTPLIAVPVSYNVAETQQAQKSNQILMHKPLVTSYLYPFPSFPLLIFFLSPALSPLVPSSLLMSPLKSLPKQKQQEEMK